MAAVTRSQAKGSITFSSGFFAEILDISHSGIKRESLDATNMSVGAASAGTFGNKINIPSLYIDPGELTVEINFNPDTLPPIGSAAETVTVTIGGDTVAQATWAGSGYMIEFSYKAPLDGKVMTATAKIRYSGAITRTAGS